VAGLRDAPCGWFLRDVSVSGRLARPAAGATGLGGRLHPGRHPHRSLAEFQYCWWTRPGDGAGNDFWAQGNHWQFIYVVPSRDLVLVRFGIDYSYAHWPELLASLARRL
jgi:CubicO group peptidase (beta-lactamase class C family)